MLKTKKIKFILALAILILTTCAFGVVVFAATNASVSSDVSLIYEPGTRYILEFGTNVSGNLLIPAETESIIFGKTSDYQNVVTDSTTNPANYTINNMDVKDEGTIKLYYNSTSKISYILSSGIISFNADSDRFFGDLRSLKNITFDNISTTNLLDADLMFNSCVALESLDLSSFNTSKVTSMYGMFSNCTKLKELNIKNFDTSNVENFGGMFNGCSSLEDLDLSNFKTLNSTKFSSMFAYMSKLKTLDLSSFQTSNATEMRTMFSSCSQLETVYVGAGWDTDLVSDSTNMFNGCTSLVGGNGTVFNSSYTDKTYAVVDTVTTPGYLTLKTD